jgi:hypothetical protein
MTNTSVAPYAVGDRVSVAYEADDVCDILRTEATVVEVRPVTPAWNLSLQWWEVRCAGVPNRRTVTWLVDASGRDVYPFPNAQTPDGLPWIAKADPIGASND